jgi:RNA polymerase sigma factor FliA
MASPVQATYQEAAHPGAGERERLILDHLPQVRWVAIRIHEKLPDSTALEDLISVGILGLIAAVDNFDARFGVKLATYAEHKIRGAILDSIRGMDGIATHKRKFIKQIEAAINTVEQRVHRTPSEEEIAAELGIDLDTYRQWLLDTRSLAIGSLDAPLDSEGRGSLLNYLPDSEDATPARQFERAELERLIAETIENMPKAERTVLSLYYYEELNLREIAPIMGLHLSRISQLKTQATLRLRAKLQNCWPHQKGIYK